VWLPIDEESVNNPWHIWIDVISKFRLLEKRWSTDFTKYCYVLANESRYFAKVIEELFPEIKVLVMPKNETWQFKHLLVPSASNTKDGVITPYLAPWLRHFKGLHGSEDKEPYRKIVVLRPGAKTRRMTNSDELLLALKGWETVVLETMTIREQMKTFAEATHIVAAHGAGLVNLLWCKPGTKVIEIQDTKMIHKKVYPILSHHLGLKHELYLADTVPINLEGGKKPKGIKRLSDLINFKINVPDLLKYLD
jgi:capsular polysaccharide biosynthesis protein